MRARREKTKPTGWYVATDSEWDTSLQDPWISTAFAWADGVVVFFRDDVPDPIKTRLEATAREIGADLQFVRRTDDTDLTRRIGVPPGSRLLVYFSPKDIEYAVGWETFKTAIREEHVRQRNNISGKVGELLVKDVCGWAGKTSLVKFAGGLGVPMVNKTSMDGYKANMWRGLNEMPEDFLKYAVDDARVLLRVQDAFVDLFRTVQVDCLGMGGDDLWTVDDIPMTCGALVAKTFERWLYSVAGGHKDALKVCIRKLGILDPDHKAYKRGKWAYWSVVKGYKSAADIRAGMDAGNDDLKALLSSRFLFSGLDGACVRWWASRPATETQCFNALVQGGRCMNENPYEYEVGPGLDVDISGCYGDALRNLVYPVGLPSVWSCSPNERRLTFGAWLDKNEGELIDGLWTAVVSGGLEVEQDLIFSKLARASDIRRSVGDTRDDDTDIDADFVMLRKEIVNGVITSDILKTLRAVCTNAEWAGVRDLQVVTAAAYLKRDRRDGVGRWCESVLADAGRITTKWGNTSDLRSRAWYGVPLEQFVGRLADTRKHYKRLAKAAESEGERVKAAGLDGVLKLLVNTLYGALASRYFVIGNTVLANNITARARLGVWMTSKALATRQSITDGGIYVPDRVCSFYPDRRPGLDTLSRQWEWANTRYGRKFVPLGGRAWADRWDDLPPASEIDTLAMDHVRAFWSPYGVVFPFKLEHKAGNTFTRAAYWSKADYALSTGDKTVYAVRGKDKNKRSDMKLHPTFTLLDHIIGGDDKFPDDLSYTRGGILKIGKYQVIQASNGFEGVKHLRPGDTLPTETYVAQYNNTHMPMRDAAEYHRRRNRKKQNRGRPVPWFERHAPKGISGVHEGMVRDNLRA